jgi:FkbM family methyltransferase
MKREAVTMHGVPARRVAVTGAAAFDHWFEWQPSGSREAFCARVGLPFDRPYVLYLCSSKFVAPHEASFVRAWLGWIRESAGALHDVGVLIRPHPQNAEQWAGVNLNVLGPVAVWPPAGAAPIDPQTRSDYFDSMYHSTAVVGINTTAEIESAIVGRPVHTLLAPEFRDTQEGTLHFHHLRRTNGGVLHVARDVAEHIAQLDASVSGLRIDDDRGRRFVEGFVRPFGLDVPATPRLVEAIERLAADTAAPAREAVWASLVRRRLTPRAAELARRAELEPVSHRTRRVGKAARHKTPQVLESEQPARLTGAPGEDDRQRMRRAKAEWAGRRQRIDDIILDFQKMGDLDRRSVVSGIEGHIPAESFVGLYAANKPRRLDYEHADIYLRVTSKTEAFRVKACGKEPFTIDWIHSRIQAGDVMYDIGANVGAYSFVAAKKPGGGARVYSFEASYANVAALSANVALNGLAGAVMPVPVALSDRTAMDVFNLRDMEPGGARHALGIDVTPEDGPTVFPQPVMVFRLDDLVEQFGLPLPNHIKLDVDGGELDVLKGAFRTLASPALRSLLVEVSTSLSTAVAEVLGRSGLRLEAKIVKKNKAGEYAVWYGLFGRGSDPATPVITTEHVEPVAG